MNGERSAYRRPRPLLRPPPLRSLRRQRGAALLILLTLAGLSLASLLIGVFGKGNRDAVRERRTLAALAQASDALTGFAAKNGRLPRPARSALDGRETPLECASEAACTGFLPWVTLAVDGADSWGKLLRYSVTPALTQAPIRSISAVATKTVQERGDDGVPRYVAGQAACEISAQCAPFVVFSSGKNNLGTSTAGIALANGAANNVDEMANQVASVHFFARVASDDPARAGGPFDDLVRWGRLEVMYKRMRAARTLP